MRRPTAVPARPCTDRLARRGEKRIGYVSILRLVESARELHWRRDIAPLADLTRLDSITKSHDRGLRTPGHRRHTDPLRATR